MSAMAAESQASRRLKKEAVNGGKAELKGEAILTSAVPY